MSPLDRDADLIWAAGKGLQDDSTAYSMMFADPGNDWVFTVMGSTPELRVGLVEAFCEATAG